MTDVMITVREVVRLLWEADSYPLLGNEDRPVAERTRTRPTGANR